MKRTYFAVFVALTCLQVACGEQYLETETESELRSRTSDFEYKINVSEGLERELEARFSSQTVNLNRFGVLNSKDIQTSLERVMLLPGANYSVHSHSRSAEVLYLQEGNVTVWVGAGGKLDDFQFVNNISAHGVAVLPQGMVHNVQCFSTSACVYLSYFNSADPGLVRWEE